MPDPASERASAGADVGVVVIGRNEGERLVRCLASIETGVPVVYADSGSRDDSVARARERAAVVAVVELDASLPFTAARGRNAGFEALLAAHPDLALVQFVDGDCQLVPGWLADAREHLLAHPEVGVVFGRRRERHPEASPWNRLADIEWDGLPGETDACGGDAMIRVAVLRRAGGYDPTLIAGEEPELCLRIRRAGARVVRLDREMTLHDANLLRIGQWWRRQLRSGHAYADTVWRHRGAADSRRARRLRSLLFWGGALPAAALLLAVPTCGASLLLLAGWAWPWRGLHRAARALRSQRDALLYASFALLGKVAECIGALTFAWNHAIRRRATELIEYKGAASGERR